MRSLLRGLAAATLAVAVSGGSGSLVRSVSDSELDAIARVFHEGEFEIAETQLEEFVDRYPEDARAWTILGHTRLELHRLREAGEAYERLLR